MSRYFLFSQPEHVAKNATLGYLARNRTRDFARSILVNLIRWNKATLMEGEGRRNEERVILHLSCFVRLL